MRSIVVAAAALVAFAGGGAAAQTPGQNTQAVMQSPLGQQVLTGCSSELSRFCANVTPGEGRLLACLFAYEDQLSGQCEFALYDAAVRLERAIGVIVYVATECRAELEKHCAEVEVGEGRVAQCLKDHESELSEGCNRAMTEVGMK
jgi:Cysteine rich repeat